jgi:hypothetical protein
VIGLTGEGLHIDAEIALGSARLALPVVAADRQGVTAVSEQSHQALARVRLARSWADRFMSAAPAVVTSVKRQWRIRGNAARPCQ